MSTVSKKYRSILFIFIIFSTVLLLQGCLYLIAGSLLPGESIEYPPERSTVPQNIVFIERIEKLNTSDFTIFGMDKNLAEAVVDIYSSDGAFKAEDGTLFLGTKEDIDAGNYAVAGSTEIIAADTFTPYIIKYQEKKPVRIDLSHRFIITFIDDESYSITSYSEDPGRTAVELYFRNTYNGHKLILKDFDDIELVYGAPGGFYINDKKDIQTNSTIEYDHYQFNKLHEYSFHLINQTTGISELYTPQGLRFLAVPDPDFGFWEANESFETSNYRIELPDFHHQNALSVNFDIMRKTVMFHTSKNQIIHKIKYETDIFCNDPFEFINVSEFFPNDENSYVVTLYQLFKGTESQLIKEELVPVRILTQLKQQNFIADGASKAEYYTADGFLTIKAVPDDNNYADYTIIGEITDGAVVSYIQVYLNNNGRAVAEPWEPME